MTLDVPPNSARERRELEELRTALAREERISQALRDVGNALGATLDLDDLLELILAKLKELVEADKATLYLLDESRKELVSRVVVGDSVRSIRIKVGHGIAGVVAQTGRPIRVIDAYKDPRFERDWDLLTGYRTTSMLVAPLKNHLGRTIGVIQVLNKKGSQGFTTEDEAILSALSTQAAVAIDNSRLFLSLIQKNRQLLDTKEELERRVQDLELLFELERSTARAASLEELVTAILSQVANSCAARGAAILLVQEETRDLVEFVYSAESGQLQRLGIQQGEGLLAFVLKHAAPLQVSTPEQHPSYNPRVEGSFAFPVKSLLALPLEGDVAPLGAIGLFTKRGLPEFTRDDLSLMRLVSANASTAVRLFNANQQRERGERLTAIGRLLSQVIHDFKTPMTVISGYVQLMQDADDSEVRARYTEEILKQFDSLSAMQREVLEFARGERSLFVRRVYLRKFFAEIGRDLAREVEGRGIELEMQVDSKAVARFDEGRMARAVHNLSRNAVEAMADRGGKLKIEARLEGPELLIAVSDTGPGIPQAIEGQLFQSFVTLGKEGGTGLGLAIVKKIVDEHGGTIRVDSSANGARFEVRLPQPQRESSSRVGPSAQRPSERQRSNPRS